MANPNRPSGFSPVSYLGGANWNGQARIYSAGTSTGPILVGDPVASSGTADVNGIAGVVIGVAGSAIRGVVVAIGVSPRGGPYINVNDLTKLSILSGNASVQYLAVVDDPNVIFEIQELSGGTQLAAVDVGLNVNFNLATAGVVPLSGCLLDNAGKATTSTLNCKLLGLTQYAAASQNVFGAYAKWQVLINNHELRGGITGVA